MSSTPTPPSWDDAIEDYLHDQQDYGRINSSETVRAYWRALELHAKDAPVGPLDTDREDVKRTLARWPHPNTRARNQSVLVSFYDWMLTEGRRPDNPARQVRPVKMRKPEIARLTRAEVVALIAACEATRERRVVLLGLCTGARASELIGLQGRHFAQEGFVWFSADIAKGQRERWVPVLPELESIVRDLRASCAADHHVIRAYNNSGVRLRPPTRPVSYAALSRLFKGVARRAGITRRVHLHLLRHAFGDHVARHAGLHAAQGLMGHASVNTTASTYVERAGLDELAASVQGLRFGEEPVGDRRERLETQMRHSAVSTTVDFRLSVPGASGRRLSLVGRGTR
jgi:site-specific recombinase XerD